MSELMKTESIKIKKRKLGFSASLSACGGYSIAGGPGTNRAYIYNTRAKENEDITLLIGEANSVRFGHCVHINAYGNVAIVSDPYKKEKSGAVYIYIRDNERWYLSSVINHNLEESGFGWVVRLNDEGNIAMITAPNAILNPQKGRMGAVYFYENINGDWKKVSCIEGFIADCQFGFTATMSSDGRTVLIGDYNKVFRKITLNFFENSAEGWRCTHAVTYPEGPPIQMAVSLNHTGDIALVGFASRNKVEVHQKNGSKWDLFTERSLKDAILHDYGFGQSVSLNAKGDVIAIGAYKENNKTGAVYIYKIEEGKLVFHERLAAEIEKGQWGRSVSLSAEGNALLVGCTGQDNGMGRVYYSPRIFEKTR